MNSQLFSLRRHERPVFLFALLLAIVLQAIIICRYNDIFTNPGPKYWAVFLHNFSVSGYDPITYSVVTDWTAKYNVSQVLTVYNMSLLSSGFSPRPMPSSSSIASY